MKAHAPNHRFSILGLVLAIVILIDSYNSLAFDGYALNDYYIAAGSDTHQSITYSALLGTPLVSSSTNPGKGFLENQFQVTITNADQSVMYAVDSIVMANCDVDSGTYNASEHFDSERFDESQAMILIRWMDLLADMNKADYEQARQDLGKAFHIIQDYYSHSSWVELGYNTTCPYLVPSDTSGVFTTFPTRTDVYQLAPLLAGTECGLYNRPAEKALTSGYYKRFPENWAPVCVEGIPIKCRHGDRLLPGGTPLLGDGLSLYASFMGLGMNKDTVNSPECLGNNYHQAAAYLAMLSSIEYLNALKDSLAKSDPTGWKTNLGALFNIKLNTATFTFTSGGGAYYLADTNSGYNFVNTYPPPFYGIFPTLYPRGLFYTNFVDTNLPYVTEPLYFTNCNGDIVENTGFVSSAIIRMGLTNETSFLTRGSQAHYSYWWIGNGYSYCGDPYMLKISYANGSCDLFDQWDSTNHIPCHYKSPALAKVKYHARVFAYDPNVVTNIETYYTNSLAHGISPTNLISVRDFTLSGFPYQFDVPDINTNGGTYWIEVEPVWKFGWYSPGEMEIGTTNDLPLACNYGFSVSGVDTTVGAVDGGYAQGNTASGTFRLEPSFWDFPSLNAWNQADPMSLTWSLQYLFYLAIIHNANTPYVYSDKYSVFFISHETAKTKVFPNVNLSHDGVQRWMITFGTPASSPSPKNNVEATQAPSIQKIALYRFEPAAVHPGFFPIHEQPLIGETNLLSINVVGAYQAARFETTNSSGFRQALFSMTNCPGGQIGMFVGPIVIPSDPFQSV